MIFKKRADALKNAVEYCQMEEARCCANCIYYSDSTCYNGQCHLRKWDFVVDKCQVCSLFTSYEMYESYTRRCEMSTSCVHAQDYNSLMNSSVWYSSPFQPTQLYPPKQFTESMGISCRHATVIARISSPDRSDVKLINLRWGKTEEENKKLQYNLNLLNKFEKLPHGWNDYGADPFPKEFLKWLKLIVAKLPVQPEIFPTAADSVQMEYSKEDGAYLEFEIYTDRSIKAYEENSAGEVVFAEKFVVEVDLNPIVEHFHE